MRLLLFILTVSSLSQLFTLQVSAKTFHSLQAGKAFIAEENGAKIPELLKNPVELKKATVKEITIHAGDEIVFENRDEVTHNLYSNFFDLHAQAQGSKSAPIKFDKAGEYDVQCALHPKMKLKVKVQN